MAKLCGVQIKNLKTFRGMEYPTNYQGTVYLNGTKLGFWSQDGNGGMDNYEFNTTELDKVARKYMDDQQMPDYYDTDVFMGELLTYMDMEKQFKQGLKKGYPTMMQISSGHSDKVYWLNSLSKPEQLFDKYQKEILKVKEETEKSLSPSNLRLYKFKVTIYKNISDFDNCEKAWSKELDWNIPKEKDTKENDEMER